MTILKDRPVDQIVGGSLLFGLAIAFTGSLAALVGEPSTTLVLFMLAGNTMVILALVGFLDFFRRNLKGQRVPVGYWIALIGSFIGLAGSLVYIQWPVVIAPILTSVSVIIVIWGLVILVRSLQTTR